ncbi:DNA topoisomerase III [Rheinheimera maricola]|uniref:DNA topoisomerase n=1 Tax=Rheinheimera maricola TaxID=2793282 RepID=A0ABS7XDE6_9GAMM|nr:DNA topoisomerase III [Rheinheimera maricola]MBZ9613190.1 DNA topoisomerase III [Rheinheimera maricola]
MILYIAEKPSLARAIAAVLPKPQYKDNGFIRLANGDVVSWCIGHLLQQAEPEDYNADYKRWQATQLPIVPDKWLLTVRKSAEQQLNVLRKLLKQADSIVHAGDPDREGQLLVDEVLAYCNVGTEKLAKAQRLLINDLNPPAVKKALSQLRPNKEFVALSTSALARSRADWLYGLNMTRAYTLQGQKAGYQGVLSVGRVQTPLLGLVVRRDQHITDFVSKPFYQVVAHLETDKQYRFNAMWQPSNACAPWQDEEGRVLLKALAEKVQQKVSGQLVTVMKLEQKATKQAAPLPYNLSALQIDAAKRYGMSAQQVLDCCQQLYERHKLITYPRSDNRYLPREHLRQVAAVCQAIATNSLELAEAVQQANTKLVSKAWDDKKVEAHHAIIPTEKRTDIQKLTQAEQRLYQLIARQYLAQFYPAFCNNDTKAELDIAGGCFIAKARTETSAGWKQLYRGDQLGAENLHTDDADSRNETLPTLVQGQQLICKAAQVLEKHTQPPQAFTDASLLAAMIGIGRYVKDETIRKILRDTDGLGTEATRAGIIELLFKRGFLKRDGKKICATTTGAALISVLPEQAVLPDMTARWEVALNAICQRQQSYQSFMQPLLAQLQQLVAAAAVVIPTGLPQQKRTWRKSKPASNSKTAVGRYRNKAKANGAVTKRN